MVIDSIPSPFVGLIIIALLSIIIEAGYRVGKLIGGEPGLSRHPVEASVTTAILGLMAFMLGFAFASAANRYGKRNELSLKDANTAGTLYLRADFLPAEHIEPARALIREYVETRLEVGKSREFSRLPAVIARSAEIQNELWAIAVDARQKSNNVSLNLFITVLNDLIDLDTERQTVAFINRFPPALWATLAFLCILATTMLGLSSGLHGRRSRLASTALIVSFSVVIVLIVDLDRPVRSLFHKSPAVMEKTLKAMQP